MSYTYVEQESELVRKARMVTAEVKAFEKAYMNRMAERPSSTPDWTSEAEHLNQHYDEKLEYFQMMFNMNVR